MDTNYFATKLISPRPSFPMDITEIEKEIMERHSKFWDELFATGTVIVVGSVMDPNGIYGFGIIMAQTLEQAKERLKNDPAIEIMKQEIYPMMASVSEKLILS